MAVIGIAKALTGGIRRPHQIATFVIIIADQPDLRFAADLADAGKAPGMVAGKQIADTVAAGDLGQPQIGIVMRLNTVAIAVVDTGQPQVAVPPRLAQAIIKPVFAADDPFGLGCSAGQQAFGPVPETLPDGQSRQQNQPAGLDPQHVAAFGLAQCHVEGMVPFPPQFAIRGRG